MKKVWTKIKNFFVRIKPSKRKIVQLYAALLTNANIKGFFNGQIYKGATKNLCVPGLNCYSCPGAIGACPLGSLQNALMESDTRLPAYIFGTIILFGLLLGRTICGWLCPIGLGQELLYKIKTPKVKKNKVTNVFSYLKYVLLAVLVLIVPMIAFIPGFCEYICPAGTFEGGLGLLLQEERYATLAQLGPLFTWKFTVMVLIIVGSIFFFRFFCRFLCPLGALYGFFCRIAVLGVKLDKNKCTDCGLCITACKMDIKHVGDHECIHCGDCIKVCPAKAISWKAEKIFVRANDVDAPVSTEIKPLASMLKGKETPAETEGKNE
ncbi:MAG: 4Fe-4S binding protein [Clostridiales bacterium]|nr:4Fe-4S binding protein [Clostridiales bacterium]